MLKYRHVNPYIRRGTAITLLAVAVPVLLGFAALAVDVGHLYMVRAQLQNAADAAALAGAGGYLTDARLAGNEEEVTRIVQSRAVDTAARNTALNKSVILDDNHIMLGFHDFDSRHAPFLIGGSESQRQNAVEVTAHRTAASSNGPVPLIFATILGHYVADVTATATAAMNDRVGGYRVRERSGFLPFTIHEDLYDQLSKGGPDHWSYDDGVAATGDGIPEVRLFPWKLSGQAGPDGTDGSGNFGTLNVGISNQGTTGIETQITNGLTAQELEWEFRTSELTFTNEDGSPNTYVSTGNPGLSGGMRDTLVAKIGDVIGFFIHRTVRFDGSNAQYEITGMRFGRIVEVALTGSIETRAFTVQPVAYTDAYLIVDEYSPSTDGQLGRVMLVR